MPVTIRLPHRLGIVLPSRDRRGRLLGEKVQREIRKTVQDWFAGAFPGSTGDRMQMRPRLRGRWTAGSGVTVEAVEEVWAYCSKPEKRRQEQALVELAEWVAAKGDQDAVAILIDSGMELVERETQ